MVRVTGIKKMKMFLTQPFSVKGVTGGRCMSNSVSANQRKNSNEASMVEEERQTAAPGRCWMPHPHSGIYFPAGGDWVMDGVPNHAASFDRTFWLRNIDGVDDKPYHDDCNYP